MPTEENKALVRRSVEVTNRQDYAAFDALLAPTLLTDTKQMLAYTDHQLTITDMIAEGDQVWVRLVVYGEIQACLKGFHRPASRGQSKQLPFSNCTMGRLPPPMTSLIGSRSLNKWEPR